MSQSKNEQPVSSDAVSSSDTYLTTQSELGFMPETQLVLNTHQQTVSRGGRWAGYIAITSLLLVLVVIAWLLITIRDDMLVVQDQQATTGAQIAVVQTDLYAPTATPSPTAVPSQTPTAPATATSTPLPTNTSTATLTPTIISSQTPVSPADDTTDLIVPDTVDQNNDPAADANVNAATADADATTAALTAAITPDPASTEDPTTPDNNAVIQEEYSVGYVDSISTLTMRAQPGRSGEMIARLANQTCVYLIAAATVPNETQYPDWIQIRVMTQQDFDPGCEALGAQSYVGSATVFEGWVARDFLFIPEDANLPVVELP